MSSESTKFAVGFAIGAAIGLALSFLYAPQGAPETRKKFEEKILDLAARALFNLRWLVMTPRERYVFLLHRAGSLRDWRTQYRTPQHAEQAQSVAKN